jgi:hypothetical protein
MKTIIVAGALANKPGNGGEAWVRMSWVQALEALGFRVVFLEEIETGTLLDGQGGPAKLGRSRNAIYFDRVTREFGLEGRAALLASEGGASHGLPWERVLAEAESAELLVNIGGHLTLPEVKERVRMRAYVDIDPGFVQIWEATGIPGARLGGHHFHFTIGQRIGTADCPIPTQGRRWIPLRQPVLLDAWPPTPAPDPGRFTTVASWRGAYGPVQLNGRTLGTKVHQFRRFVELPRRAPGRFEIALSIHPADGKDLEALRQNGWIVSDPARCCGSPAGFRCYVQGSGAEFSAAQGVYVDTRCGWFSDRTIRYLASGRPAVIQDTGLEGLLPLGRGLLTFETMEGAVEGVKRVLADPTLHARAARALARDYFAPEPALAPLLAETGARP